MKITLLILLLCSALPLWASTPAEDPDKTVFPFLDIFKAGELDDESGFLVKSFYAVNGYLKGAEKLVIEKKQFDLFYEAASAVFKTEKKGEENKIFFGTAFSIGNNLVLTNVHVLSENFRNLTSCSGLRLQHPLFKTYSCRRVVYCQVDIDTCLIEMKGMDDLPALKLSPRDVVSDDPQSFVATAIGNPFGDGIKVSSGKSIGVGNLNYYFHAPISSGNSGGPLLDEKGDVIGVIHRESRVMYGPSSYGVATRSTQVIKAMRENLTPEDLELFNQSVLE